MKRSRFVGLALSIATVVAAVFTVERGAEDDQARFGKILGRPIAETNQSAIWSRRRRPS